MKCLMVIGNNASFSSDETMAIVLSLLQIEKVYNQVYYYNITVTPVVWVIVEIKFMIIIIYYASARLPSTLITQGFQR